MTSAVATQVPHPNVEQETLRYVPKTLSEHGVARPRGSTERTHRLASSAANRKRSHWSEWPRIRAELEVQYAGENSPILRQARIFHDLHNRLTPLLRKGELLVGARHRHREEEEGECSWAWEPSGYGHVDDFAKKVPEDMLDCQAIASRG
ncbi:MAG: hypothetical protein HQL31_06670 [Planctomycetes bacterium]|nr:hypothetical protein [Planctomycetota bacterium]